jgi:hypothetical protein
VLPTSLVPGKEQRRFRRYSVNFPCEIKPAKHSAKRVPTHTQDVSCGGLYFTVSGEWETGMPIEFVLHLPLKAMGSKPVALRCQGKVSRVVPQEDERVGIGATIERFEFIHLDSRESKPGKMKTGFPNLSGL